MALDPKYQTRAQLAAYCWARLRTLREKANAGDESARVRFQKMIWWLYGKVQSGDLSSNDARLSFNAAYGRNLTAGQWTTFVQDTLKPIRDRYQAMLDQGDL